MSMGLVLSSPADGVGWRAKYTNARVPRSSRGTAFALVVSFVCVSRRRYVTFSLFSLARAIENGAATLRPSDTRAMSVRIDVPREPSAE